MTRPGQRIFARDSTQSPNDSALVSIMRLVIEHRKSYWEEAKQWLVSWLLETPV